MLSPSSAASVQKLQGLGRHHDIRHRTPLIDTVLKQYHNIEVEGNP